jgi:hypothetical protein
MYRRKRRRGHPVEQVQLTRFNQPCKKLLTMIVVYQTRTTENGLTSAVHVPNPAAVPSTVQLAHGGREVSGLTRGRDVYNTRCYFLSRLRGRCENARGVLPLTASP